MSIDIKDSFYGAGVATDEQLRHMIYTNPSDSFNAKSELKKRLTKNLEYIYSGYKLAYSEHGSIAKIINNEISLIEERAKEASG